MLIYSRLSEETGRRKRRFYIMAIRSENSKRWDDKQELHNPLVFGKMACNDDEQIVERKQSLFEISAQRKMGRIISTMCRRAVYKN